MVYRLIATFVVLVSIVGVAGLHASGTTVIPKTLPELAREAQLIVIATVTDSRAEWLDDTGLIYTHCDLAVEATLKGKAPRDLRVSEPGGTVGTMTLAVPSMPRYATGSRVLIFLSKDALGLWRTQGLEQGRFLVVNDARRDEDFIRPDKSQERVIAPVFPRSERFRSGIIPLEDFVDRVRQLATTPKAEDLESPR